MDFDFQPRLETGVMSYTYEQNAFSESVLPEIDGTAGSNDTLGEIEVDTTMGFIGGGATLFFNRLFVDLSGQYAFDESDQVTVIGSTPWKNLSYSFGVTGQQYQFESDASDGSDWGETVYNFKIGLAYVF